MRKLEFAFAAALIVAGLVSLALQKWAFVDPTKEADWAAAAAHVVDGIGEDDVFRIEPWWYERGLTHLTSVGGQADRIRQPILEDLYTHENIWLISQADRLDDALDALPFEVAPISTKSFGTVTVARVPVPKSTFKWELRSDLERATVTRVRGEVVEKCDRWNAHQRRWDCGRPARWLYVGEQLREVGDDPRQTIWAHPLDGGRTLRIESTVPTSDGIRVRGSFDLRAARLPRDGEVMMQVFVDGDFVHQRLVAHDDHSYAPFDIDVSAKDAPVRLRIDIDLRGSIKDRYFFVNAWAFDGDPP